MKSRLKRSGFDVKTGFYRKKKNLEGIGEIYYTTKMSSLFRTK
jgi:hypothetical protein